MIFSFGSYLIKDAHTVRRAEVNTSAKNATYTDGVVVGSDRNLNRWGMSNLTELHEVTSNSRFEVRLMQKKKTSEDQWGLRVRFEVNFF